MLIKNEMVKDNVANYDSTIERKSLFYYSMYRRPLYIVNNNVDFLLLCLYFSFRDIIMITYQFVILI